jgi:hypothetical protein
VLGSELPITFVHDLVVHPRDHVAVIATHGRGMFTLDVSSLVPRSETAAAPASDSPDESAEAEPGDDD